MRRTAPLLFALALAGGAVAQTRPGADDDSLAQQCYAQRELAAPPDFCRDIAFLEGVGRVMEVALKDHYLRLAHDTLPGINVAGTFDYYVEPAYLLAAVDTGDRVHFVVESRNRHIVDVYPLLATK